jgi:uncharacterized protein
MVKAAQNEKLNLMSQITGLTEIQAKACDEALDKTQLIPYLKLFALNHAQGLSGQQWQKAYQFKKEYEYLTSLAPQEDIHAFMALQDKFYPFDVLLKNQVEYPSHLKTFDVEKLLSLAKDLISNPNQSPDDLITSLGEVDVTEAKAAMQYVLAIHWFSDAKLLHNIRKNLWEHGQILLAASNKNNEQAKALIAEWPANTLIKKIDPVLFLKFWHAKKNGHVEANFEYKQQPEWMFFLISQHLSWQNQNRAADSWIAETIHLAIRAYFQPRIYRDILAMSYDQAVEQLLPIVETQWRQVLMQKAVGEKHILMFFPHGKAGVMVVLIDPKGQVLKDFTLYPHAPDYDMEQGIAEIVKVLTRYPIEHMGWLVQFETRKSIHKMLKLIKARYPDLNWQLHLISHRLTPMFTHLEKKAPSIEDVAKAPQFLQNPWPFWTNCQPEQFLHPILRSLPKEKLRHLWRSLLQEILLIEGIDVNHSPRYLFELIDELQPQDIDKLIKARETDNIHEHKQIQELLNKDPHAYAHIAAFMRMGQDDISFGFLEEDKLLIDDILQHEKCNLQELLTDASKISHAIHETKLLDKWGQDRLLRIQNILMNQQERKKSIHHFDASFKKQMNQIPEGTRFLGTIHKIMNYGCFVDLGENTEGLVHISAIGDCFINDLNLIFQPGETVVVEWINYDEKQKRLSLRLHSEKTKKKPVVIKSESKAPQKQITKPKAPKSAEKKPAIGPSAMELAFAKLKQ